MGEPLTFVPCRESDDVRRHYIPADIVGCGFQVGQRGYLIAGNHWIAGCSWHCLEDLQTGERYDVIWPEFDKALDDERVKRLNEMETLAWTAE